MLRQLILSCYFFVACSQALLAQYPLYDEFLIYDIRVKQRGFMGLAPLTCGYLNILNENVRDTALCSVRHGYVGAVASNAVGTQQDSQLRYNREVSCMPNVGGQQMVYWGTQKRAIMLQGTMYPDDQAPNPCLAPTSRIVWFADNGDTLRIDHVTRPMTADTSYSLLSFSPHPDGGYMITGTHSDFPDFMIQRHRADGSIMYRKLYGTGAFEVAMGGTAVLSNGDIVICGYKMEGKGKAALTWTDSLGTFKKTQLIDPKGSRWTDPQIRPALNDNIWLLFSTDSVKPIELPDFPDYARTYISLLGPDGNMKWKRYLDDRYDDTVLYVITGFEPTPDGGIAIAGYQHNPYGDTAYMQTAWATRFDSLGNRLWNYTYPIYSNYRYSYFLHIAPEADGSLLCTGQTSTERYIIRTFTLRLSPDGCLFAGDSCAKGGVLPFPKDRSAAPDVVVAPNPSSGHVKVTFAEPLSSAASLTLYSMTGAFVRKIPISSSCYCETNIDLTDLAAGTYYLKLEHAEWPWQGKIILIPQ